ncbi:hypothetical protein HPB50_026602 [Hyalomma asiaticum]|uniref:Uncharacterized protein n=1 Tax=Hyalomma asiaticum TaxID=266040 RepID=A0ACB7TRG4_HYAAI|nr:hypothetical protein HPB50_026602 [Hyalomma asiaticum]
MASPTGSEDDPVDEDYNIDEEFLSTGADLPFAEFVTTDNDVLTCESQSVAEIVVEVVGARRLKTARE